MSFTGCEFSSFVRSPDGRGGSTETLNKFDDESTETPSHKNSRRVGAIAQNSNSKPMRYERRQKARCMGFCGSDIPCMSGMLTNEEGEWGVQYFNLTAPLFWGDLSHRTLSHHHNIVTPNFQQKSKKWFNCQSDLSANHALMAKSSSVRGPAGNQKQKVNPRDLANAIK